MRFCYGVVGRSQHQEKYQREVQKERDSESVWLRKLGSGVNAFLDNPRKAQARLATGESGPKDSKE